MIQLINSGKMNSINTIEEFNNIINTPGKHVIKVFAD